MERLILHSDLNNFYASVECLEHPELRSYPVVVGGSVEERHGIVLAKNELAKRFGVRTGEALWQARRKCPEMVVVAPNFPRYSDYSQRARDIYLRYTDRVEPFGLDECWLELTGCGWQQEEIAEEIRRVVCKELGLTVSVGASFNKVFAKLGSDLKKPNAVTVIDKDNFRQRIWPLAASDLLYVGPATSRKLAAYGITTIGQLANTSPDFLRRQLGKMGEVLHQYANGADRSPVARYDRTMSVKSIGNSSTAYRDLENDDDVKMMFFTLCEAVAARVREQGFYATTLSISVRDTALKSFSRQCKLERPSSLVAEYAAAAMRLFCDNYRWELPLRSIGVSVSDFVHDNVGVQLDLLAQQQQRDRAEQLEGALDRVRGRYGNQAVQRAVLLQDRRLTGSVERDGPRPFHHI